MEVTQGKLIELLRMAYRFNNTASDYWKWMLEAEDAGDEDTANFYWCKYQNYEDKAFGMLKAYELITGKEVINAAPIIKRELELMELPLYYGSIDTV